MLRTERALRRGVDASGKRLSPKEREELLKPLLPVAPPDNPDPVIESAPRISTQKSERSFNGRSNAVNRKGSVSKPQRRKPVRTAIKSGLHIFFYALIHFFFAVYIRIRSIIRAVRYRILGLAFYHHRTPELIRQDLKTVRSMPDHLSVILKLDDPDTENIADRRASIGRLMHDVGEIVAWSAAAEVPLLSVYERTGVLKNHIEHTHAAVTRTLERYFGPAGKGRNRPSLSIRAPQEQSFSPPVTPPDESGDDSNRFQINVLLISEEDGRSTLVDLTKTLAEMAQQGKLEPSDMNAELIDAELGELVMDEPDLLILFGPRVILDGYPPWQVRLTEIFHMPDHSERVSYSVFVQALLQYSGAQKRFGR